LEGDAIEIVLEQIRGRFPNLIGPAGLDLVAERLILDALDEAAGPFQGLEDVTQLDLGWLPGERIAAARAPDAFDEVVDFEGDDDLLKIADRNPLVFRDAFENHGLLVIFIMAGEIEHESGAVSSFCRKLYHARLLIKMLKILSGTPILSQAKKYFNINL